MTIHEAHNLFQQVIHSLCGEHFLPPYFTVTILRMDSPSFFSSMFSYTRDIIRFTPEIFHICVFHTSFSAFVDFGI